MCVCVYVCVYVWIYVCVCVNMFQCLPLYFRSPSHSFPVCVSDVGALGVVGGGSGRWVGPSLFGVVKAIVVLVGAGRRGGGLHGAAGDHRPPQQGEDRAHPSGVQGKAEGHKAVLPVGPDGEPHRRHHPTHGWGRRQIGMN